MANRVAVQTGNFGTATTWEQGTNTATLNASTNVTLSTAASFSATYTAPNIINASTGCLVYYVSNGGATTLTATLQEATVDTAHSVTITLASVNPGFIYFRPTLPYVFTAITANRYRWKIVTDTGTAVIAQATTANFAFIATDNRNVVPTAGDNCWIVGANNSTATVVTLDGTRACGNSNVAGYNSRTLLNGMMTGNGGSMIGDTTASHQLTCTGGFYNDAGGGYSVASAGTPLSSSFTSTLIMSGAQGNAYFGVATGATSILQGTPKLSSWSATYVSGLGTAASPMITDADIGVVGDEILVAASSNSATNYSETESRFIITKNSSTSYVLSTTSGGAEVALTYTHTSAQICNVQRNVILKGLGTSNGQAFSFAAQPNTTNVDIDWVRFENIDPTLFFSVAPVAFVDILSNVNIDYSVAYYGATGLFRFNGSNTATTHTGLISYHPAAAVSGANIGLSGGVSITTCQNKTLVDCYSMQNGASGFALSGSYSNTFTRCKAIGSNTSNNVSGASGFLSSSSGQNAFVNCEAHANRGSGMRHATSIGDSFNTCLFGTKGTNGASDIFPLPSTFNSGLFDSCTFGSTAMITGYLLQTLGSEIRFNRVGNLDNAHEWYNVYGSATSEQTIIRSPGLAVRLRPENLAAGFSWQFQVPVVQNSIAGFRGFFLKNPTLGTSVATVSMYLPGNPVSSGVPDAMATLNNTTGSVWGALTEQNVNLSAAYLSSIPGAAEIIINVKSNTAGAYLYADDFYNAGDRTTTFDSITGLNLWVGGKPLSVISPSVPSADDTAAAVWAYLTANMNVSNSAGTTLVDAADNAELAAIK